MARRAADPLTQEQRIARAFADLEEATRLAFEAKGREFDSMGECVEYDEPDLQALARFIELSFKANGVLTADGKRNAGDTPVSVPIEEVERLLKAAKNKAKPNDSKES